MGPRSNFSLAHASVQTTKRYMGVTHKRVDTRNATRLDVESPGTFGIVARRLKAHLPFLFSHDLCSYHKNCRPVGVRVEDIAKSLIPRMIIKSCAAGSPRASSGPTGLGLADAAGTGRPSISFSAGTIIFAERNLALRPQGNFPRAVLFCENNREPASGYLRQRAAIPGTF